MLENILRAKHCSVNNNWLVLIRTNALLSLRCGGRVGMPHISVSLALRNRLNYNKIILEKKLRWH